MATRRLDRRAVGGAFAAGAFFSALIVIGSVLSAAVPPPGADVGGYITLYRPPTNGFESLLDQGDGQAYAALAQDPTISHPADYFIKLDFAPALAARPLFWGLLSMLSFGQRGLIPVAFTVMQIVAGGLLAAAAAASIQVAGRADRAVWGAGLVFLPGALTSLRWYGPEVLALALALIGVHLWQRGGRPRAWAAGVFVAAALTRELTLVVPFVVALAEVLPRPSRAGLRRALPLTLAPLAYGVANVVATRRMGLTLSESTGLIQAPWAVLFPSFSLWGALDWAIALAGLGLVGGALWRCRGDLLSWMGLGYVFMALTLNQAPLHNWEGFSRVLLPMYVLPLVALIRRPPAPARS